MNCDPGLSTNGCIFGVSLLFGNESTARTWARGGVIKMQLKCLSALVSCGMIILGSARPIPAQQTGTLVFDMKNYTSDAKLPDKIKKQLEHAGYQWGMVDRTLL